MAIIRSLTLALATMAPSALANLLINNWCGVGISVVTSHNGGCDSGADGRCITDGSTPWTLAAGSGQSILNMGWVVDGEGTSIKVSKDGVDAGILQFEYTVVPSGQYAAVSWDLSDLDGAGPGLVGTPFANDNVKVSPTGDGVGVDTCQVIHCPAGQVCVDAYQQPDDAKTRTCPVDTGDMWLDLCEPAGSFKRDQVASRTVGSNNKSAADSRHESRHAHGQVHHARSHVAAHKRHFRA